MEIGIKLKIAFRHTPRGTMQSLWSFFFSSEEIS